MSPLTTTERGATCAAEITHSLSAASFVAGQVSAGRKGRLGSVVLHRPEEKLARPSLGSSAGIEVGLWGAGVVLGRAGFRAVSLAGRTRRRSEPSAYTHCWSSPWAPPPCTSSDAPVCSLHGTFSHGSHLVPSISVPL